MLKPIISFQKTSLHIEDTILQKQPYCMHRDLVRNVEQKHVVALVLLDLISAFNRVDHTTLFIILERRFVIRKSALTWFTFYLSDRTQIFNVSGVTLKPRTLTCGISQGFVLGPIEFTAYTAYVTCVFIR
jgi:hypothetical protein